MSSRLDFLRAAPGARVTLKPGRERTAQFAALKADYRAALERAASSVRSLGESPASRQPLWALAEWAAESQVKDVTGDYTQLLTRAEQSVIMAPSPKAPADPHE